MPWRMAAFGGSGSIQATQYRYDLMSNMAYGGNPIAYRCINMIASSVASVPYKLFERLADGTEVEVEEAPVLELLKKPNPFTAKQDFFHNAISYLQISGNTFIHRVGADNRPPTELYTLNPQYITIIPGSRYEEYIKYYTYGNSRENEQIEPEYICHLKLFNPVDNYYGMSPGLPAIRSIQQSNSAMTWNVSLLKNNAKPSGVLSPKKPISDDQFDELHQDLSENFTGEFNAGNVMVTNDVEWQRMSLTPSEMDWLKGMVHAEKLIAVSWGVDPVLIGDSQNRTYQTFKDAQKSFYFDTVIPLLYKIQDYFLNGWLLPLFPNTQNMFFRYDLDEIDAITEDRNLVYERVRGALKDKLLTVNEARDAIGYGEILESEAETEDETEQEEIEVEEQKEKAESQYVQSVERLRKKWDIVTRVQVSNLFDKEKTNVIRAVADSTKEEALYNALNAINIDDWRDLYKKIYSSVMQDFGEKTVRDYKKQEDEDIFGNEKYAVLVFIEETIKGRTKEVTDTTKNRLTEIILGAIASGILDIEKAIEELYKHDTPIRSRAIAQTEVITAGNASTRFAAKAINQDLKKEWVAIMDDRTRITHRNAHGEIRNMNEKYSNGLMYPGDPLGRPEETINCRCVEVYHL
jgi:HK97 family phage portal protein